MSKDPAFDLGNFLTGVLLHYRKEAMKRQIELSLIDDMASHVLVSGNRQKMQDLLETVLQNSLSNPKASRVSFTSRQLLRTPKEILLEFLLEDNGSLPAGAGRYPYFRNIILARRLIEDLGGKSEWIYSPAHGSMLKFVIKCQWLERPAGIPALRSCTAALQTKKLLVVEDNEINLHFISQILHKQNIPFAAATSGTGAIDLLSGSEAFHLVLMDQHLPHMDGLETTSYIRRILRLNIPIIGMINSQEKTMAAQCLETGMNKVIRKPFTEEELLLQMCSFFEVAVVRVA